MATLEQDRGYKGLDLHHEPENLAPGYLTVADNLLIEGGDLVLRPGLTGLFTAPLASAPYEEVSFTDKSQSSWIVFISGGKLFKSLRGSSTNTEILNLAGQSLAVNSVNSRIRRQGLFAYIVDGSEAGPVYRFDLLNWQLMGTLKAPLAPVVKLINNTLIDCSSVSNWVPSAGTSSTNLVQNPGFEDGFNHWNQAWANSRIDSSGHSSAHCSQFDNDYGSNIGGVTGGGNDRLSQTVTAPNLGGSTTLYPRHYTFSMWGDNRSRPGNIKQATVVIKALDSNGATVDSTEQFLKWADSGWKLQTFDFSINPAGNQVVQLLIVLGQNDRYSGSDCLYIDDISLSASNTGVSISQRGSNSIEVDAGSLFIAGDTISYTPTAPLDWSLINIVSFGYALLNTGVGDVDLRITLYSTDSTGAVISEDTNTVNYTAANNSFFVDLSAVDLFVRKKITKIAIHIIRDLAIGSTTGALFAFGPIVAGGNLTINRNPYTWLVTEANPSGSPITESPTGTASNTLTPTSEMATALVVIAPTTNVGQTTYNLYRYGGVNTSGLYTLVAQFDIADNNQFVPNLVLTNPYVTWNASTRTVTDNTPDEYLLYNRQLPIGADNPPLGAQAMASWQNRLWLAVGSQVYASWAIAPTENSQLHFTSINIPDDPQAVLKGATFGAGGSDNDPIQAMWPFGTTLIVFKKRSVWVLSGSDPNSFSLNSYLIDAGVGLVAPRAVCVQDNRVWFLGPNGVNVFDASIVSPVSTLIDKVFPDTGDVSDTAYIRTAFMLNHGYRVYLFMPDTGSTKNDIAYVWDTRVHGWTKLLNMPLTSGYSFGSAAGDKALFLGGTVSGGGQLFELAGQGDKSFPASVAIPVAFQATQRAYGKADANGYWTRSEAQTFRFNLLTPSDPGSISLSIIGDNKAVVFGPKTYYTKGIVSAMVRCPGSARGETLQASISGLSLGPLKIKSMGLEISEGYLKNG